MLNAKQTVITPSYLLVTVCGHIQINQGRKKVSKRILLAIAVSAVTWSAFAQQSKNISLQQIGQFETGVFDESAAEIVAYDAASYRLFVINANENSVDVLDISDPMNPTLSGTLDVASKLPDSGGVNSVAVREGLVALAVEHDDKQNNGWIAFYDTDGNYLNHVGAGALPDAISITHNGQYVLAANEGEPSDDYSNDPEGSVTIVDISDGVMNPSMTTAGFTAYNDGAPAGVRITGPNASVAQDLEPEFIATSHDSSTAWVTLQENNALAMIDIKNGMVTDLVSLGNKDHSIAANALDASNKDDTINIQPWPILGTYMPDAIAAYRVKGQTFLVTANEGDAREYIYDADEATCEAAGHEYDGDNDCISHIDEIRVGKVNLDPAMFNEPTLQDDENLGRLKMLTTEGDTDGDGDYDEIHAFGARSISIWDSSGSQVYDSGDIMEQQTALALPENFNSTNDENDSFDNRSDDKGPEPEGLAIGKVRGNTYAFVGLERVGGIMIFNVSKPAETSFVSYVNNRDFTVGQDDLEDGLAGDLGPEGLLFIKPDDSPNGEALLVVGNEVSGSTTIYQVVSND